MSPQRKELTDNVTTYKFVCLYTEDLKVFIKTFKMDTAKVMHDHRGNSEEDTHRKIKTQRKKIES